MRMKCFLWLLIVGISYPHLAYPQDLDEPLKEGEGYLFVAISMNNFAIDLLSIDGGGSFFYAHDFRGQELQSGINYKIIKLPEGEYYWRKIVLQNGSYFNFGKTEFPISVKAGYVNYGGWFVGSVKGTNSASFEVINRASAAIQRLEYCCQEMTETYPIRYGGGGEDPYLSYYFSLKDDAVE